MARAARPEGSLLRVRVQPRARRNEIEGWQDASLRVRVTAPPAGGAANRAVVGLLAGAFGVTPSSIELVSGERARDKLFRVGAFTVGELRARLEEARG
jgi:uncharacterized protein (TIGR00251 family)